MLLKYCSNIIRALRDTLSMSSSSCSYMMLLPFMWYLSAMDYLLHPSKADKSYVCPTIRALGLFQHICQCC